MPFARSTIGFWNSGDNVLDGSGSVGVAGGRAGLSMLMLFPHAVRLVEIHLCANMRWSILMCRDGTCCLFVHCCGEGIFNVADFHKYHESDDEAFILDDYPKKQIEEVE